MLCSSYNVAIHCFIKYQFDSYDNNYQQSTDSVLARQQSTIYWHVNKVPYWCTLPISAYRLLSAHFVVALDSVLIRA